MEIRKLLAAYFQTQANEYQKSVSYYKNFHPSTLGYEYGKLAQATMNLHQAIADILKGD